jgi:predicted ATPase/class 3 adenylate cyclase
VADTAQWTFLFSDIESSTRLWERHPDEMPSALARHDEMLHSAVEASGGKVFKHTGDGICAAFPAPAQAVTAAIAAQLAFQTHGWGATGPLRVRMAVHVGAAERRDGDFFGPPLNRTARLLDTAHGGQIVLSLVAAEMARDNLKQDVDLVDLGEHRLADLARPERVWQVVHPDLPSVFPTLRSLSAHRQNLPVAKSSFVGRAAELEAVADLLHSSRLVTVVGLGGVGKTRLALQVAAGSLPSAPDGVFFVELAPLADPTLVPSHVARTLGLTETAGSVTAEAIVDALCAYLRERQLLMVLDNCEHVIDSAAALADAVAGRCPGIRILATSREPLEVSGEVVWRAPSLGLPGGGANDLSLIRAADAVTLFCERARAADHDFVLTPDNAPDVARICHRLDGIPLALELAAARLKVLTAAQIADRLDDRFRLLGAGPRTVAVRQRTLRATMDWSYDLLAGAEQILLQRISVFAGGFTLEGAEAVAGDGLAINPADVLDLLARLVDKSLVGTDGHRREARYSLLETVKQYAAEKLIAAGADDEFRRRHRDYYAGLAAAYLDTDPQAAEDPWITDTFVVERANLREALDWSLGVRDGPESVAFVAMLGIYWTLDGHFAEAWARIEPALSLEPHSETKARTRALNALGFLFSEHRGAVAQAITLHGEALAMARRIDDQREAGLSAFWLGTQLVRQGDLTGAEAALAAAMAHYGPGAADSAGGLGHCEFMLGWVRLAAGDPTRARRHFEDALVLCQQAGSNNGAAHALSALATMAAAAGETQRAEALAGEGVLAARRLGWSATRLMALTRAAEVGILSGNVVTAAGHVREALELLRDRGGNAWLADTLEMAALIRASTAALTDAARLLGATAPVGRWPRRVGAAGRFRRWSTVVAGSSNKLSGTPGCGSNSSRDSGCRRLPPSTWRSPSRSRTGRRPPRLRLVRSPPHFGGPERAGWSPIGGRNSCSPTPRDWVTSLAFWPALAWRCTPCSC